MAIEYTGGGDPRRSLELLWGTDEPPARGRKPGLSVDRIVAAAIALADREGLEAVSMRRVAQELGGGTMSLYRHVPGKGELLDLMFDRALGETLPGREAEGGWRERVAAIARGDWELYHRHPWMLQVSAARPPLGPNVLDGYESLLRAVDGIGLTGAEMNEMVMVVADYVAGAARRSIGDAQAAQATGESDESWWAARESFWSEQFTPERYPTITRIYADGGYERSPEPFEYGLERLLDGIEAHLDSR